MAALARTDAEFQSTPLPTGRSDEMQITEWTKRLRVSIHAPPNRKERLRRISTGTNWSMFQSTPLPTGRSDCGLIV